MPRPYPKTEMHQGSFIVNLPRSSILLEQAYYHALMALYVPILDTISKSFKADLKKVISNNLSADTNKGLTYFGISYIVLNNLVLVQPAVVPFMDGLR
jgi:hypothetical protein